MCRSVRLPIVLGEDPVERAARVGEHLGGLGPLGLAAVVGDLPGRDADLHREVDQLADAVGHALAGLLPRVAELLAVLLDVARGPRR